MGQWIEVGSPSRFFYFFTRGSQYKPSRQRNQRPGRLPLTSTRCAHGRSVTWVSGQLNTQIPLPASTRGLPGMVMPTTGGPPKPEPAQQRPRPGL